MNPGRHADYEALRDVNPEAARLAVFEYLKTNEHNISNPARVFRINRSLTSHDVRQPHPLPPRITVLLNPSSAQLRTQWRFYCVRIQRQKEHATVCLTHPHPTRPIPSTDRSVLNRSRLARAVPGS